MGEAYIYKTCLIKIIMSRMQNDVTAEILAIKKDMETLTQLSQSILQRVLSLETSVRSSSDQAPSASTTAVSLARGPSFAGTSSSVASPASAARKRFGSNSLFDSDDEIWTEAIKVEEDGRKVTTTGILNAPAPGRTIATSSRPTASSSRSAASTGHSTSSTANVQSTRPSSSSAAQPRPNSVVTSSVQDYATLPHFDRNDRGYIIAYTDGCCRNNGKKNAAAGIGVYWYENCPLNVSKPLSGVQTNNRAELQACVVALKTAKENNLNKIEIRTDSNFVKAGITLWILKWKANGWKSSTGDVKNKEDWQELDDIRNQMDVEWTWVMAHGGNPGNEMAYKLANAGADKH